MSDAGNRDLVLLGIRYEAARIGGVGEAALAEIVAGIAAEAGEGWQDDPMILHGRNAVRVEHGLPRLGERPAAPKGRPRPSRAWYRRLF